MLEAFEFLMFGTISTLHLACHRLSPGSCGIDLIVGVLLRIRKTHQRLCNPVRMMDVVEAEAAFDAKAILVRRAVGAFSVDDLFVLHFI